MFQSHEYAYLFSSQMVRTEVIGQMAAKYVRCWVDGQCIPVRVDHWTYVTVKCQANGQCFSVDGGKWSYALWYCVMFSG